MIPNFHSDGDSNSNKETIDDDNNDDIHDRIDVEFQAPLSPSRGIFLCSVLCFAEVAQ